MCVFDRLVKSDRNYFTKLQIIMITIWQKFAHTETAIHFIYK